MKSVRIAAAVSAVLFSCASLAAPGFVDAGPNLSDNGASGAWTSLYATRNPAGSEFAIAPDASFRMGILSSIGIGMEVGPVDNFSDEIDDLTDALDRDDLTLSEGNALVERFNAILDPLSRAGYVKVHGGVQVPLFPMLYRSSLGVFTLDANLSAQARLGLLDAPLTYNSVSEEVETASAAYVKAGQVNEIALGYSRSVWQQPGRRVIVGGSLRYLQAKLSKQVVALESIEDDEDVQDVLEDSYDANERKSSNVTVDIGAIYDADNYRVGVTLANLTEPDFEYGAIGANCELLSGSAQYNCFSAAYFSDRIALNETWTLERLATLEGAVFFASGRGSLAASVDLNDVHDPVGDLNQNAKVALGYKTQTNWLPDLRVGYRKNLAGSELSSASLGFTFFGAVHFDVSCSLESTDIDGSSVPRTAAFNLGFEMSY
ncbi:conjugal transfer protein TraF [Peristeroidobacter agariperforans]|uniref:conjugal transfer protein TraF n=1 Tax=Peristeroidobacter agariperforans TaxID=268404 RepID=UPI00101DB737|nr:conjugal transfer protein TraF [Peristeroidobacter agariperforans]